MSDSKKNIFPKLKKKLSGFLTDESGKISKKDALWLGAGALFLAWVEDAAAAHSSGSGHSSSYGNEGNRDWWGSPVCTPSATHASWIVNGHYNANFTANLSGGHHEWAKTLYSHGSHGSHGSHSSSGSGSGCGSWDDSGSGSGDY